VRGLRWWIASLLFAVTLVNLVDRLTISVLAPVIIAVRPLRLKGEAATAGYRSWQMSSTCISV